RTTIRLPAIRRLAALLLAATALTPVDALAQTTTWIGGTSNFNDSANWSNGTPALGTVAAFGGTGATNIVTIGQSDTSGLTFNAGASAYTITTGGNFNIWDGGIVNNSGQTQTINVGTAMTAGGTLTFNSSSAGNATINAVGGNVQLSGTSDLGTASVTIGSGRTLSIQTSQGSTSQARVHLEAGSNLAVTRGGEYTTTIGTLKGAGIVTFAQSFFNPTTSGLAVGNGNESFTFDGTVISDTAVAPGGPAIGLAKVGTGTLTLTGTNSAVFVVEQGTVHAASTASLADSVFAVNSGATFSIGGNQSVRMLTQNTSSGGAVDIGANTLSIVGGSFANIYKGDIVGTGSVTFGAGAIAGFDLGPFQQLSYTGGTTITGGAQVALGTGTSFAHTGKLDLDHGTLVVGGVLIQSELKGGSVPASTSLQAGELILNQSTSSTYNGSLSLGALTLNGSTTGHLTLGGNLDNVHGVTINDGRITVSGTSLSTSLTMDGGRLTAQNANVTLSDLNGNGSSAININDSTVTANLDQTRTYYGTLSGSGTANFVKSGTGTLTLSGASSGGYTTTVNSGTLQGDTNSLVGPIVNNATVIFNQAATGTYAGALSGSGTTIKSGTGTVTLGNANNTFAGTWSIQEGTLQAGAANTLGSSSRVEFGTATGISTSLRLNGFDQTIAGLSGGAGLGITAVDLGSGSLTVNQATDATFAGMITGTTGSFTKSGAGKLTVSLGWINTTGTATVSGGTLQLDWGSAAFGGAVSVASGATLAAVADGAHISVAGALTTQAGSIIQLGTDTYTTLSLAGGGVVGGTIQGGGLYANFNKLGNNTLLIDGTVNIGNVVKLQAGTIRLGAGGSFTSTAPQFDMSAGTVFDLNGRNATIGMLNGSGEVKLGTGTLTMVGGHPSATDFYGTITGAGGLVYDTSMHHINQIYGTLSHTGGTSLTDESKVVVNAGGAMTGGGSMALTGTSQLTLDNGQVTQYSTLNGTSQTQITVGTGSTLATSGGGTFSGALGGAGNLTVNGAGTLVLGGTASHTGTTTVSDNGILELNATGSLTGGGAMVLASGGQL
ncbi:MAG: hypothetical protein EPO67_13055, partial [Reyranella sp.]